jgi:hypothetical protein
LAATSRDTVETAFPSRAAITVRHPIVPPPVTLLDIEPDWSKRT